VGEGNLPQQGAWPVRRQQHVTLIDDQEQRADDDRHGERSLEHRPVAKRATSALHDRPPARLEDERGGAARGAARAAGRAGRFAHGPILVRRRPAAASALGWPRGRPNVVYGRAGRRRPVAPRFGQEAPGFPLPSSAGGQTSLADFKDKSAVVLVFYCYDWGGI